MKKEATGKSFKSEMMERKNEKVGIGQWRRTMEGQ